MKKLYDYSPPFYAFLLMNVTIGRNYLCEKGELGGAVPLPAARS